MKKILVLLITILLFPGISIMAMEVSAPDGIFIEIRHIDCQNPIQDTIGNVDILVKRDEVKTGTLLNESPLYTEMFGDIPSIDYLNHDDEIWVSYLAYVNGANIDYMEPCYMAFMYETSEYLAYSQFKLVYFNDMGETLFISDAIDILHAKEHQARQGEILFYPTEDYRVDNNYTVSSGTWWGLIVLFLVFYIFRSYGLFVITVGGFVLLYGIIRVIIIQAKRL